MLDKLKWFWRYYKRYKYVLFILFVFTPIQGAFQVMIPRLIEFTVDFVKTGEVNNSVAQIIAEYGAMLGFSEAATFSIAIVWVGFIASVLYAFVQGHRAWMNLRLEWAFRQESFNGITHKGPDFYNKFRTGDLVTRMTDDVAEKLSWFACSGIFRFYEAIIFVAFSLAMMITIDPWLTLFSAGPLPLLIVIFFKSASALDKRYERLQKRISILNDAMEACFYGIRVVKAYVREKAQKVSFGEAVVSRRDAEISSIKAMTIVDSLYHYIWQVGIVIIMLTGGYMAINGTLTMGKLIAFVYYIVYMVFPMFDIGQFLVKSRQSAVSINRLLELEQAPVLIKDAGVLPINGDVVGNLKFDNVSFAFDGMDRKIIDSISFEIKKGQTIAVVGKVGSGKSWLTNMIPRLVDPTSGSILLDGHKLSEYRLDDLRRNIGYVPQEPVLFSDSVKNNIVFGRENISDELLNWAIDVAQLRSEIETFPDGLETAIGTRGMSISGGQKQRLALARALVGKPRILILDDCTSALDSRTESDLWDELNRVLPDMTAILITHRPDTLEKVDNVYVLEDGKITESGIHKDLIGADGHYSKIYRKYQLEAEVGNV